MQEIMPNTIGHYVASAMNYGIMSIFVTDRGEIEIQLNDCTPIEMLPEQARAAAHLLLAAVEQASVPATPR